MPIALIHQYYNKADDLTRYYEDTIFAHYISGQTLRVLISFFRTMRQATAQAEKSEKTG